MFYGRKEKCLSNYQKAYGTNVTNTNKTTRHLKAFSYTNFSLEFIRLPTLKHFVYSNISSSVKIVC